MNALTDNFADFAVEGAMSVCNINNILFFFHSFNHNY